MLIEPIGQHEVGETILGNKNHTQISKILFREYNATGHKRAQNNS